MIGYDFTYPDGFGAVLADAAVPACNSFGITAAVSILILSDAIVVT